MLICRQQELFTHSAVASHPVIMPVHLIVGDVFCAPLQHVLARAVGADFKVSAAVAAEFVHRFGGAQTLRGCGANVGDVAIHRGHA